MEQEVQNVNVDETIKADNIVTEVVVEEKSPTQHRVERERKKLLRDLGVESVEEGQSLIEEARELSQSQTALTTERDEITKERDELKAELEKIKLEKSNDDKRNELRKRLVDKKAIDPDLLISALDINKVDGNYDEIVEAFLVEKPNQFVKETITGDHHVNDKTVELNPMAEAVAKGDTHTAMRLFLDTIIK